MFSGRAVGSAGLFHSGLARRVFEIQQGPERLRPCPLKWFQNPSNSARIKDLRRDGKGHTPLAAVLCRAGLGAGVSENFTKLGDRGKE
ncbi:MAG: hypothetical protein CR958_00485 [Rhodobacterales bacterium]|nr:MAG: hypothetical protein CR958_00485 [Rhodobacterales bacterium]